MELYRVIWRFYRDHRDITHVVENQVEKDMENAMGTRGWVWGLGFLGFIQGIWGRVCARSTVGRIGALKV